MADGDGAIRVLEQRRVALLEGLDAISHQEENIKRTETNLEEARKVLRRDKEELLDIEQTLKLLKAGREED